ncbi:MAG: hypothetical protein HY901_12185 [Deltaproteobacteria bacterium]|nr:hypothetical protein [Deltaproteobacteria bacterium]
MTPTVHRSLFAPRRWASHFLLIWQLRLMTGANRYRQLSSAAPAALGLAVLLGVSLALGLGAYALMAHPAVAASARWSRFLLRFIAFLVSVVFVVWPVLSAGVDEHSELSRFVTFPIRPIELFLASSLSGLIEPRALVFYPVMIGTALGYAAHRPFPALEGTALLAAYFAFNVAWGRASLTLVLNVLRHRRSAEILGVLFLGGLFLASLAPPIDVSWLSGLFKDDGGFVAALGTVDDRFVLATSKALGNMPPCALAIGLEALAREEYREGMAALLWLLFGTAVGFGFSFWLLVRFYKGTARPARPSAARTAARAARARDGAIWALIDREASDFVRNPKARLLCSVPFFLCILLRFVHARDLAAAALGPSADTWLVAVLCSYAALVVGANFAQNVFAYDGPGLALLFATPVPLRSLFVAKNVVHAAGTLVVSLALIVFYALYVHPLGPGEIAVGLLTPLVELPVLLGAGNFLSVLAPRKFHASLRRRDRPPAMATSVGLLAAAAAVAPLGLLLRLLGEGRPGAVHLAALLAMAAALWFAWSRLLPRASELLAARRETVLRLVMRE